MGCHVPERGKQTIRYYGAYSNASRGKQRNRELPEPIPTVLEPEISSEAFRRNWARLIQKVFEVDPLICPRCRKQMRIVAAIENPEAIRRILEHLGLWLANARPTPRAHSPPGLQPLHEDAYSQPPGNARLRPVNSSGGWFLTRPRGPRSRRPPMIGTVFRWTGIRSRTRAE